MKKLTLIMITGALALAASCNTGKTDSPEELKIDNTLTEAEKAAGILTPEVMWKMGRIGEQALSPDGKTLVYTVTWYNLAENRSTTSLYCMPAEGGEPVRLTDFAGSESTPQWSKDGSTLYFLSNRSGSNQLWSLRNFPNPLNMKQYTPQMNRLTDIAGGLDGYGIAPTGDRIWYVQSGIQIGKTTKESYPDLPKTSAMIYDDLMERHWDHWTDGSYSHIFVALFDGANVTSARDILEGEPYDAPLAPYFDTGEIAWSNDGRKLAYTCKKLSGAAYAVSTDSDIYIYDTENGNTVNITQGMPGYDKYPRFSPGGTLVAFASQARPGNEADLSRLFIKDLVTGEMSWISEGFDYSVENLSWEGDDNIWFTAAIEGSSQICRADVPSKTVTVVTSGDQYYSGYTLSGDQLVGSSTQIHRAAELFKVNKQTGTATQLTFVNKEIYDHIKMPEAEKRWVKTTDGKDMLVWVIVPPDFDPAKKYPALLYCSGGPQSVVGQDWSYRWNFELMAAQGYVVVAPNRRGTTSFGQEWTDQISGDYSGQNMRDYLSAIDALAKEPWVDADRLGCVGASYGGYSAFYLAGHHNKRFKAFISHCGMFNLESFYGSTEETFFPNNDLGGPYWDRDNAVAQRSYANSPHKFVQNWDTPILIFSGLNDFRIPYTESLQAFHAARLQGIPARLVTFPDEAHQVFKPQNNVVWNREFFGWLDKYVKGAK